MDLSYPEWRNHCTHAVTEHQKRGLETWVIKSRCADSVHYPLDCEDLAWKKAKELSIIYNIGYVLKP